MFLCSFCPRHRCTGPIVFVVALDAKSEASFKSPTATEEFDAMISSKFSGTFGSHDFKPVYYYVTRDEILRRVPRGWFTLDKVLMGRKLTSTLLSGRDSTDSREVIIYARLAVAVALLLVGLTDWNIFQTNSSPCQCGWQLQRQAEEMKVGTAYLSFALCQ